jgi:hypothetical protein
VGALIIIAVLVVLWAYKSGRPMKLVLTREESKAVRAKWWAAAIVELKVWTLFAVFGYALAADTLAREQWDWSIYVFIVWCSLLLFSRLAIWVTIAMTPMLFAVASLAHGFGYTIPDLPLLAPLIMAVVFAIIIRAVFLLNLHHHEPTTVSTVRSEDSKEHEGIFSTPNFDDRVYDYDTDTYLYKEGNREPAFIRYPRNEDRPENRRKRAQYDDVDGL